MSDAERKIGYIDCLGRTVIAPHFESALPFSEGLAEVQERNKSGLINSQGTLVVPYVFDRIKSFSGGLAPALINGKYGMIDRTGHYAIAPEYDDGDEFRNGRARVQKEERYGFIDFRGKESIPLLYDQAEEFHEGLAIVGEFLEEAGWSFSYLDWRGQRVLGSYRECHNFWNGFAEIRLDSGEHLMINRQGNTVWKIPDHLFVYSYSGDGVVSVQDKNLQLEGYVDLSGKWVIPPQFDSTRRFEAGVAEVYKKDLGYNLIDREGKLLFKLWYKSLDVEANQPVAQVKFKSDDDLIGIMTLEEEIIVPATFTHIGPFREGLATAIWP